MSESPSPTYLGDSVYASVAGGMIALTLNDHRHEPLIYLEPEVLTALFEYAVKCGMIRLEARP